MNGQNTLQLTYIPSQYWTETISGFTLESKDKSLPADTGFFLVWVPLNNDKEELVKNIKYTFPNIPAEKLFSCKINLALPLNLLNPKNDQDEAKNYFGIIEVIGKIMPIPPAIRLLYRLEVLKSPTRAQNAIIYSESVKTWALLAKFIFELLNRGNFIPFLHPLTDKEYEGKWRLVLKTLHDHERFKIILNNTPWSAYNIPINFIPTSSKNRDLIIHKTDGLWHKSYVFSEFMDKVGDYLIKLSLGKKEYNNLSSSFVNIYRKEIQLEENPEELLNWEFKFIKSLINKKDNFKVQSFSEKILPKLINDWVKYDQNLLISKGFIFTLKLQYPEKSNEDWPLEFYISSQDDNTLISLKELWEGNGIHKNLLLKSFESKDLLIELIYKALGTCAKTFHPIQRSLNSKFPDKVSLTSQEVMDFLYYPKDLLIQSGFSIELPEVFTRGGKQRISSRLVIHSKSKEKEKGTTSSLPTLFNINSMLSYEWKASLEGEELTKDEFQEILNKRESLINWRGKWVLVESQDIKEMRTLLENNKDTGNIEYLEALKLGLKKTTHIEEGGNTYDVIIEGDLSEIIERLDSIESFADIPVPKSFNGKLRPYQEDALKWLGNMCLYGFGVCLADDMGLGKTIQVLAFLLSLKENYPKEPGSVLIVCPTSVLFNWEREIKKFTPKLEVMFHHGPKRIKDASGLKEFLIPHRLILTSYGTLRNDIELLQAINFNGIILDESQNIKNYASKQSQAAYKLQGRFRICLSGTPIENRLLELWTLFEFLNPGLLGKRSVFQKDYILPIERFQDQDTVESLRRIINPFILRRMKSDKSIINDLPDKNEIKVFIELSDKQIKMYEELVEKTLEEIKNITTDQRKKKGLVLTLLMQLKQLCNHPNQYLKINASDYDIGKNMEEFISHSKKVERLLEMTEEVLSGGEKILIFTQFRKMGDYLKKLFEAVYAFKILYFHGGVPQKKRRDIVDEYQSKDLESPPILILSLKAGGTGLNLTRGTTVFHFDRWWNPAVENQATDRAYRIGQDSQVNVYKFITIGTIEEKIDALLEEKKGLAEKIIASSGESWISNLNDEKLKDLLILKK